MIRYVINRVIMLIPVMLGVMLFIFLFQAISPDDPVRTILGPDASDEQIEEKRVELGLDKPVLVQFVKYVYRFVRYGDLGTSYVSGQPVMREIMLRFPVTLRLSVVSVLIGVLLGVPLGIVAAVKQNSLSDNMIRGISVFISSFPNFWLALLMILFFSVQMKWLPAQGIETWRGWILPTVCVALGTMGMLMRNARASMLEAIRQDYVRTARAKGQTEYKIIVRHVLRNSLIPIINSIGVSIGFQLGGALVIESVFGMPGIGMYAVSAIANRNYPAVLGSVVILAFAFTLINLLIDICFAIVDPKLKITFAAAAGAKKLLRAAKKREKAERAAS